MKTKAFAKGIILGTTIVLAAIVLSSCTTITSTAPDGTVTVTKSTDPTTAALIAATVSDIARATVIAEK